MDSGWQWGEIPLLTEQIVAFVLQSWSGLSKHWPVRHISQHNREREQAGSHDARYLCEVCPVGLCQ